jgi:peptidoglycan/LPS O-acetylase OafA/YrhL
MIAPPTNHLIAYRSEIDGLRAIAVMAVILCHAGFTAFKGGFVGVDIFFVISGYLICAIILKELGEGNFSINRFYERRARRILPALFFVMLTCIPFALAWLLPEDLKNFSRTLIATSLFSSNIYFWMERNEYFNASSELNPLLHTWSLGVEEQYYLLFPLFLIFFWRLGKFKILAILLIVFICSFYLAHRFSITKPELAFYLLPTRSWELLMGALLAFYFDKSNRSSLNIHLKELGSWIGLSAILFAIIFYDKMTPYPGFYSLIPTIGTSLIIIFATQETFMGKLLGSKFLVGIGLISYSAYLWHQPLFAFARQRALIPLSNLDYAILSIFAFLLAYLSWRFIEIPFKDKKVISNKSLVFFFVGFTIFFLSIGLTLRNQESWNHPPPASENDMRIGERNWRECLNSGGDSRNDFIVNPCIYTSPIGSGEKILLIGDSHALLFQYSISKNLSSPGNVILYAGGSCPPFYFKLNSKCADFHRNSAEYAINNFQIKAVILSARWSTYLRNVNFNLRNGVEIVSINPFGKEDGDLLKAQHELKEAINYWLDREIPVIFVTDYPTNGKDLGKLARKSQKFDFPISELRENINSGDYYNWISPLSTVLDNFKNNPKFIVLDSYAQLCGKSTDCPLFVGKTPLLSDDNHASRIGADIIGKSIATLIK